MGLNLRGTTGSVEINPQDNGDDVILTCPNSTGTVLVDATSGGVSIADSISHTGDTNTAIRFPDVDTFTVETAGSERIRVDSTGNVGIGTDAPFTNSALHISRDTFYDLTLERDGASAGICTIGNRGNQLRLSNNVDGIRFDTGNGNNNIQERIRITSGGDVGIGTDNPTGTGAVTGNTATLAVGVATVNTLHATNIVSPANGYRNLMINGDFNIFQRNDYTPFDILAPAGDGHSVVDQMLCFIEGGSSAAVGAALTTDVPTGTNFTRAHKFRMTTGSALANDEYTGFGHYIEGNFTAKLLWGTANAKPITISWWQKAPQGTYCVTVRNHNALRHYIQDNVISAGNDNAWHKVTMTFPGDTTVSDDWLTNNQSGIHVLWMTDVGSDWQATTDQWAGGTVEFGSSNMTNTFSDTTGNEFLVTGIQIEEGETATEFEFRPYTVEETMCKRYLQWIGFSCRFQNFAASEVTEFPVQYPVQMREDPAAAALSADPGELSQNNNNAANSIERITPRNCVVFLQASASTTATYVLGYRSLLSAELP